MAPDNSLQLIVWNSDSGYWNKLKFPKKILKIPKKKTRTTQDYFAQENIILPKKILFYPRKYYLAQENIILPKRFLGTNNKLERQTQFSS